MPLQYLIAYTIRPLTLIWLVIKYGVQIKDFLLIKRRKFTETKKICALILLHILK